MLWSGPFQVGFECSTRSVTRLPFTSARPSCRLAAQPTLRLPSQYSAGRERSLEARHKHTPTRTPRSPPAAPQILVVMGLLVRVLRWAPALAGLAVTVALIPLTTIVRPRASPALS